MPIKYNLAIEQRRHDAKDLPFHTLTQVVIPEVMQWQTNHHKPITFTGTISLHPELWQSFVDSAPPNEGHLHLLAHRFEFAAGGRRWSLRSDRTIKPDEAMFEDSFHPSDHDGY